MKKGREAMDDRWNEVLDRLRDLDARLHRLEHGHGPHGHDPHGRGPGYGHGHGHHHHGPRHDEWRRHDPDPRRGDRGRGGDYDEKRVIDTIVRLVCENVTPRVEQAIARELDRRAPRGRDDGPRSPE
jgi:hypothetical protein